jgi:ribosomal-protein-alanine N-acetyltransferase
MTTANSSPLEGAGLPVIFRPMTVEDVDQVFEIDVKSFSLPWSSRSFRYEVTENQTSHPWVACVPRWHEAAGPSRVVGMVVIWLVIDEAHVGTFATHPEYRRQGIGQRLLAHGLLDVYQHGARMVFLEVRRANLSAQALYQKFGFVLEGVRPKYYIDNGDDALMLTLRELNPESIQHLLE